MEPVHCPACDSPVTVPDGAEVIQCEVCGATFDPDEAVAVDPAWPGPPRPAARRAGGWNTVTGCFGWGALWMFAVTIALSGAGSSQAGILAALVLSSAAVAGLYLWVKRSQAAKSAGKQ